MLNMYEVDLWFVDFNLFKLFDVLFKECSVMCVGMWFGLI